MSRSLLSVTSTHQSGYEFGSLLRWKSHNPFFAVRSSLLPIAPDAQPQHIIHGIFAAIPPKPEAIGSEHNPHQPRNWPLSPQFPGLGHGGLLIGPGIIVLLCGHYCSLCWPVLSLGSWLLHHRKFYGLGADAACPIFSNTFSFYPRNISPSWVWSKVVQLSRNTI